jgi:hypothetical protein
MADSNDPKVKAAEKRREEESGKKNVGFGGTLLDLGAKDAEGVDAGK